MRKVEILEDVILQARLVVIVGVDNEARDTVLNYRSKNILYETKSYKIYKTAVSDQACYILYVYDFSDVNILNKAIVSFMDELINECGIIINSVAYKNYIKYLTDNLNIKDLNKYILDTKSDLLYKARIDFESVTNWCCYTLAGVDGYVTDVIPECYLPNFTINEGKVWICGSKDECVKYKDNELTDEMIFDWLREIHKESTKSKLPEIHVASTAYITDPVLSEDDIRDIAVQCNEESFASIYVVEYGKGHKSIIKIDHMIIPSTKVEEYIADPSSKVYYLVSIGTSAEVLKMLDDPDKIVVDKFDYIRRNKFIALN